MNGVALVLSLVSEGGPPAVIMTGRDDANTVALLRQVQQVPCLRKPFSDDALFDAIRVALAA
jgi:CheY-like chemotaxis protein